MLLHLLLRWLLLLLLLLLLQDMLLYSCCWYITSDTDCSDRLESKTETFNSKAL